MAFVERPIKKLTITVKPFIAERVVELLAAEGADGILVREVRGFGRQKGNIGDYFGGDGDMTFVPKIRIECYIDADKSDRGIDVIRNAACTGRIGDGKIFVIGVVSVSGEPDA